MNSRKILKKFLFSPLSFYPHLLHKIKKFCYCKTMELAEKIYAALHKNPRNAITSDDFENDEGQSGLITYD